MNGNLYERASIRKESSIKPNEYEDQNNISTGVVINNNNGILEVERNISELRNPSKDSVVVLIENGSSYNPKVGDTVILLETNKEEYDIYAIATAIVPETVATELEVGDTLVGYNPNNNSYIVIKEDGTIKLYNTEKGSFDINYQSGKIKWLVNNQNILKLIDDIIKAQKDIELDYNTALNATLTTLANAPTLSSIASALNAIKTTFTTSRNAHNATLQSLMALFTNVYDE